MERLILYPTTKEQLVALKAIVKALHIPLKIENYYYNQQLIDIIKEGKKDIKEGRFISVLGRKELAYYLDSLE